MACGHPFFCRTQLLVFILLPIYFIFGPSRRLVRLTTEPEDKRDRCGTNLLTEFSRSKVILKEGSFKWRLWERPFEYPEAVRAATQGRGKGFFACLSEHRKAFLGSVLVISAHVQTQRSTLLLLYFLIDKLRTDSSHTSGYIWTVHNWAERCTIKCAPTSPYLSDCWVLGKLRKQ